MSTEALAIFSMFRTSAENTSAALIRRRRHGKGNRSLRLLRDQGTGHNHRVLNNNLVNLVLVPRREEDQRYATQVNHLSTNMANNLRRVNLPDYVSLSSYNISRARLHNLVRDHNNFKLLELLVKILVLVQKYHIAIDVKLYQVQDQILKQVNQDKQKVVLNTILNLDLTKQVKLKHNHHLKQSSCCVLMFPKGPYPNPSATRYNRRGGSSRQTRTNRCQADTAIGSRQPLQEVIRKVQFVKFMNRHITYRGHPFFLSGLPVDMVNGRLVDPPRRTPYAKCTHLAAIIDRSRAVRQANETKINPYLNQHKTRRPPCKQFSSYKGHHQAPITTNGPRCSTHIRRPIQFRRNTSYQPKPLPSPKSPNKLRLLHNTRYSPTTRGPNRCLWKVN